ncbi:uncharacterized protein J7T54_008316 [Emericellopsis cladophorae]|uniref:GAT domain-containing protein n=1 Tax=Emericellopsis cladophorae TaxID=2686198 RepID=A0A9Q0B9S0_9HYPO|nr:uncharacterized protein J7T54_008316 [Emericellopsis cladophorae]KAI6777982.1 hypothetical protein J7T54_008316 [Emericellopsis cladophorae]
MKSMKNSLNVGKVIGSFRKRAGGHSSSHDAADESSPGAGAAGSPFSAGAAAAASGSPETNARAAVQAFCEMGGSKSQMKGDEILHLPPIVDAAESSPAAAAECARVIRRFLGKEYNGKPAWQYNALMLVRILVDNPGPSFTRNLGEPEFVETTRKLLKHVRDTRLRHMLMEMLDDFEHTKQYDENLQPLVQMWKAQKEDAFKKNGGPPPQMMQQQRQQAYQQQQYYQHPQQWQPQPAQYRQSQNYAARAQQSSKRLPDPIELSSRLEEARTSAKLLEQVVMNTSPSDMLHNDLIKEFADRCQSASRSIQGYMQSDNPAPDNDTMESLIDTNEQLQTALNQHQRAVLNARKQMGVASPPQVATPDAHGDDRIVAWQRSQAELHESGEHPEDPHIVNGKGKATAGPLGDAADAQDPFRDPEEHQRHHFESYHPGGFGQPDGPSSAVAGAGGASSTRRREIDGESEDADLYGAPPAAAKEKDKATEPMRLS